MKDEEMIREMIEILSGDAESKAGAPATGPAHSSAVVISMEEARSCRQPTGSFSGRNHSVLQHYGLN